MADISVAQQRQYLSGWLGRRGPSEPVTWVETHVSILAFTRDRVWKCKKAVRFPFTDLSMVTRRLANCEREVALNRRLAPDVYLGVVPLVDYDGAVVDGLVEMRRLPDDRRLSTIVQGPPGEVGTSCVDDVVDLLVRFHDEAPSGDDIDRAATPAAITELWTRSLDELRAFAGAMFDPLLPDRLAADAGRYLAGRSALFADRIARRRIRDGHGDLLADDVFCLRDGPRILDCLEFDDELRFGDVLADVAFLAMDLERLGRRDLARRLLDRYRDRAADPWPASLEHFYIAYRALVRAKVACLRAADDADAAASARALLALAARHLAAGRVRLVLIGGPPASGKTTVARALARRTRWPVLHSDEVRKGLAGLVPAASAAAPVDRGLYTESWSDRTYAELLDRARAQLEQGNSVILDASWSTDIRRAQAARVAAATATDLTSFVCSVASEVADRRAAARVAVGTDASDASPAIAAELRARFVPWLEAVELDTARPPDDLAEEMLGRFDLAARAH